MKYFKTCYCILFLILITTSFSVGQTCTGSLGDPVVNITFGKGTAPAMPLSPSITSYRYSSDPCPDDGFYSIAPQSQGCFFSTWHSVSEDHTPGDVNGKMMVVNASITAGDFYKQRISGLCAGTTYEFAAWIVNLLKAVSCDTEGIDPNITFTIETPGGKVLQTYNTGDIAETGTPVWKQYGFYFRADADEVVIRMTNNALGGCGNDLALDDITFRACGPALKAEGSFSSLADKFCEGGSGSVALTAGAPVGYLNPAYQWQVNSNDEAGWHDIAGATGLSHTADIKTLNADGYQFRLAAAEGSNINSPNCRIVSNVIPVEVNRNPTADAGENLVIDEGNRVQLNGKIEGKDLRYFWTPSTYLDNPNVLNPTVTATENTTYTLTVISDDGCNKTAQDAVSVRVLKKIKVPNAFTPNGDLVNDHWKIASLITYPEASITVFNRYGQTVYKSRGYDLEWDGNFEGKPLPSGVYYYVIDLNTGRPLLKGGVSIIR